MIPFKNERAIKEWMVNLENQVTMLKANLICEQRQCRIVNKNTDGFVFKKMALDNATIVKNCADMIIQYLK